MVVMAKILATVRLKVAHNTSAVPSQLRNIGACWGHVAIVRPYRAVAGLRDEVGGGWLPLIALSASVIRYRSLKVHHGRSTLERRIEILRQYADGQFLDASTHDTCASLRRIAPLVLGEK